MNGPITRLCHTPSGFHGTFDISEIIAAIQTTDMADDGQFHDMMHGLYWDPGHDVNMEGLLGWGNNNCLMNPRGLGKVISVSDATIEKWARGQSAPRILTRKQTVKGTILKALRSLE